MLLAFFALSPAADRAQQDSLEQCAASTVQEIASIQRMAPGSRSVGISSGQKQTQDASSSGLQTMI